MESVGDGAAQGETEYGEDERIQILVQLYEGAIRFLNQALLDLSQGENEAFLASINRGRAIILEFQKTLDFQQGGEVAGQLNKIYEFMLANLNKVEVSREPGLIQHVVEMLTTLLDGWRELQTTRAS